ncbi:hypothetical protein [Methanobrevibacter sp. 87.7]|uniref:hypothetical protein n=1 Tax=Methanobrevibacter sp. 87.7 TaxID=387957 RepID=UPI001303ED58|nr:hypothetical protein [Methanobrevibacter sp. 87.7]
MIKMTMYKLNHWTDNSIYSSSRIASNYFGSKKETLSTACGEESLSTACGSELN